MTTEDKHVLNISKHMPTYVNGLTEKQRAVRYLILNSPPGQAWNIMEDCEIMLGGDESEINPSLLQKIFEEYNESEYITVDIFSKNTVGIICAAGRVKFGEYIHPKYKETFTVDHVLLRSDGDPLPMTQETLDRRSSQFRDELEKEIEDYTNMYYKHSDSERFYFGFSAQRNFTFGVYEENDGKMRNITAIITCKNINLRNLWACSWNSQWTIGFQETDESAYLHGNVRVRSHYFEDSNTQLIHQKNFVKEIKNLKNAQEFAREMRNSIELQEMEVVRALQSFPLLSDGEYSLKEIRRILPVTKERFDWSGTVLSIKNDMRHINIGFTESGK